MLAYRLLVTFFIFVFYQLQANHDYKGPELRCIDENSKSISLAQQQIQLLNDNLGKQASTWQTQQAYRIAQVNYANLSYHPTLASFYNYHQQDLYSVAYNWWHDTPSTSYFADKFDHLPPLEVFHQFYHYQDSEFCQYVKTKLGWDEFLENVGPILNEQNQLTQCLRRKCPKSLSSLQRLSRIQQQKRESENRTAIRQSQIQHLKQLNFNDNGIALLDHYGVIEEFSNLTLTQKTALVEQIIGHLNETGAFQQTYYHQAKIAPIANQAASFGIMANRALKANEAVLSRTLLEIGQNFLALGKGIAKSTVRNLCSTLDMLLHPTEMVTNLAHLVKKIGVGIGKAACLIAQFETALDLGDRQLLDQANTQLDGYVNQGRQLYTGIKQMMHDATPAERYEMLGSLITDATFMIYGGKINGMLGKLAPIRKLHSYKGQALDQLGQIGCDIHQIAGLTCAKGAKSVKRGFEVIQHNSWVIQGQTSIAGAIQTGQRYLNSSNDYLAKLARYSTKCILDPERRLMRWGNKVKKLPKECIAKVKQFIGDEAVVIDTYGNKWTSKMSNDEWLVQLSDRGKNNLVLLNETAREAPKGVLISAKKLKSKKVRRHVRIEQPESVRQITTQNRQELRRIKHKYKNEGKTYCQMYGPDIPKNLKDKTVELKGFSHIMMPELIETTLPSGKAKLDLTGMHWDYHRQLEKAGLYRLENIQYLEDGSYLADLWYQGVCKERNTFFPSGWPLEKVLEKIENASNNSAQFKRQWDGSSYSIAGVTNEGVKIKSNISKRGRSFTHYPDIRTSIL